MAKPVSVQISPNTYAKIKEWSDYSGLDVTAAAESLLDTGFARRQNLARYALRGAGDVVTPEPGAKRGRGRPRKYAQPPPEALVAPSPRRPGRPKKGAGPAQAPKGQATDGKPSRGPGRPRKAPVSLPPPAQPQRQPGRPRKTTPAVVTEAAPVKRGRGRPKKVETSTLNGIAAPVKRGRGRPRKHPLPEATA